MDNLDVKYENEYLLLHEILAALRNAGLSITAAGSESTGYTPIYEFQIGTAHLSFGTLVGVLNNPEKYKATGHQPIYLNKLNVTREQVEITWFGWEDVAAAIETLAFSGEVKKSVDGQWMEAQGKTVTLTEKRLNSLYTKFYLKQYERERDERLIQESTLSTNRSVKRTSWASLIVAIAAVVISIFQYLDKDESYKPQLNSIFRELQLNRTQQVKQAAPPHSNKDTIR